MFESATECAASARSAAEPVISPAASLAAATSTLAANATRRLTRLPWLPLARRLAAECRSERRGRRSPASTGPDAGRLSIVQVSSTLGNGAALEAFRWARALHGPFPCLKLRH